MGKDDKNLALPHLMLQIPWWTCGHLHALHGLMQPKYITNSELGTRPYFLALQQRQRDHVIELEGQEKMQKC